jgi:hypothetical protein
MKNKLIIFTKEALKVCAALVGFAMLGEILFAITVDSSREVELVESLIYGTIAALALLSVYSIIEILLFIANKE